jgi:transposase
MGYRGGAGWLSDEELIELDLHLREKLYLSAKEVARHVEEHYGVTYSERGMTALLHRLGYVYKKPKLVPGKADAEAQREFLETYEKLKQDKDSEDPIYFMDATHPRHNPVLGYGWIKRGVARELPSNTGRDRLNINGAIDLDRLQPVVRFDQTIDAASTIALFEQIEHANPAAKRIYVICDNARYYRSKAVRHFLQSSKIELVFLPPYAPNLNLIERYWKFFKKQILTSPVGDQKLTPKLAGLLEVLMRHHDEVVERKLLIKQVWQTDYMGDTRTLDVHIRWLRQAIEKKPSKPKFLKTVRGKGYILTITEN